MSSSEYNQLLKFLYFEGYADSYEEAEYILEEMTDEEFEELIEAKDIPQEVALAIANRLQGAPKFSRRGQIAQSLRQYAVERNKKRLAKLQKEEFETVVEYLFVEGYADTIEGAELMAECISGDWVDQILEISEARYWYQDKSPEAQERFRKMDQAFRERQRNKSKSNRPTEPSHGRYPDPNKIGLTQHNARERFKKQKEIEAKWAKKDEKEKLGEAKADSEDPVQRLRDRNERNVDPSVPTGYRTASRRTRHELSRGKKQQKGQKTNYDNLGNMNRSRYRQQQFKRTGNDLYKN